MCSIFWCFTLQLKIQSVLLFLEISFSFNCHTLKMNLIFTLCMISVISPCYVSHQNSSNQTVYITMDKEEKKANILLLKGRDQKNSDLCGSTAHWDYPISSFISIFNYTSTSHCKYTSTFTAQFLSFYFLSFSNIYTWFPFCKRRHQPKTDISFNFRTKAKNGDSER